MLQRDRLYALWAYVRHQLTAWNTAGEGIHSPRLFYMVSQLIYDRNAYYAWQTIERGSRELGIARDAVRRQVAEMAARLAVDLSHELKRPLRIAEVGTGCGVVAAYLAATGTQNRVTTFVENGTLMPEARELWEKLALKNIRVDTGSALDTLYNSAREKERIDMAYVSADVDVAALLPLYLALAGCVHTASVIWIAGIHTSREKEEVWQTICARPEVSSALDMYHVGMLVFDPHYLKRTYKLRI